jgi:hypothetical protein
MASAGLILQIDTTTRTFYIQGSDTGNAEVMSNLGGNAPLTNDYSLQFIHSFSTPVPVSADVTNSLQNLFIEGATLPLSGGMAMVNNGGSGQYIHMDLYSSTGGDITTLTGVGSSAAMSYAGLPESDISLFESLIGSSLTLSAGTGYSPIFVQGISVPEIDPAGMGSMLALIGGGLALLERRRKRA